MPHDRTHHKSLLALDHCRNSKLPLCSTILIHTRSIVYHPGLLQQFFHALFEVQVCLVLLQIILPVLLIGELYHKGVRIICLLACQLADPYQVFSQKSAGYIGGNWRTVYTLLFSGLFCRPPEHAVMYGFLVVG